MMRLLTISDLRVIVVIATSFKLLKWIARLKVKQKMERQTMTISCPARINFLNLRLRKSTRLPRGAGWYSWLSRCAQPARPWLSCLSRQSLFQYKRLSSWILRFQSTFARCRSRVAQFQWLSWPSGPTPTIRRTACWEAQRPCSTSEPCLGC